MTFESLPIVGLQLHPGDAGRGEQLPAARRHLVARVLESGPGEQVAVLAPRRLGPRLVELLRIRHRQGAEDEGVDEREDGGRAADPEPKRQDRDGREPRASLHQPRTEVEISEEFSQHESSQFTVYGSQSGSQF